MKQYCRYCSHCVVGNGIYCAEKKQTMGEASTKRVNTCKEFLFNPIDVWDPDKTYKPRKKKERQCDGQFNLFEEG